MVYVVIAAICLISVFLEIIPQAKAKKKKEMVLGIVIIGVSFVLMIIYTVNPDAFQPINVFYKELKELSGTK